MASPTCGPQTATSRYSYTSQLDYDIESGAPFVGSADPNQGGYTFEVSYSSVGPAGPWTPAPLNNSLGTLCQGNEPDNVVGLNQPNSVVLIGDLTPTLAPNTQYWTRWVLRNELNVQVDETVCGPVTTEDYPTFVCLPGAVTATSANVLYGGSGSPANIDPPCNEDQIQWEISTTPGGPYALDGAQAPISSLSPDHDFTGLTPNTTYYVRARLFDGISGAQYLAGPECSFTTAAIVVTPPTVIDPPGAASPGRGSEYRFTLLDAFPPQSPPDVHWLLGGGVTFTGDPCVVGGRWDGDPCQVPNPTKSPFQQAVGINGLGEVIQPVFAPIHVEVGLTTSVRGCNADRLEELATAALTRTKLLELEDDIVNNWLVPQATDLGGPVNISCGYARVAAALASGGVNIGGSGVIYANRRIVLRLLEAGLVRPVGSHLEDEFSNWVVSLNTTLVSSDTIYGEAGRSLHIYESPVKVLGLRDFADQTARDNALYVRAEQTLLYVDDPCGVWSATVNCSLNEE